MPAQPKMPFVSQSKESVGLIKSCGRGEEKNMYKL